MKVLIAIAAAILSAGLACGTPSTVAERADGDTLYGRHCYGCHALEPGRNTPAGPTLSGIAGRAVAGEADYNYSPALRRLAMRHPIWTPELMDRFLAEPDAVVPGTEMGYPGMADPAERQALIAWLSEH